MRGFGEAAFGGLLWGVRGMARVPPARRALVGACERWIRHRATNPGALERNPAAVGEDKTALGLALLSLGEKALGEDRLSRASLRGLRLLAYDVLTLRGKARAKDGFRARHGCSPPDLLTISPGRACNLTCVGCYAGSGPSREKLPFATVDRLVSEAHDLWGTRFFVLSGGEPFAYRDEGKGILDLAERHRDSFFLLYTNGTLISDAVARRLGELGNLSPGLSLEGLRERTDSRRGRGVFDKVVAATERLRREKVLFGLSLTATRENSTEILSDELVDLFFGELGALYAWIFHYMPIGRAYTVDLMMTPEQRVALWERVWSLVKERRLLIADFWNCGTATNGCISAARPGGYLYVNWNGAVSPCVFMPYAPANIHEVHSRGDTLDDVWGEPFFADIRAWQRRYGYREYHEPCGDCGNWLNPCLIRDHHAEFLGLLAKHRPVPTDEDARAALEDVDYHRRLEEFDRRLAEITDPIWQDRYLSRPKARAPEAVGAASKPKPGGA